MLLAALYDSKKKDQICLERYNLIEKLDAQNKSLRVAIGSMTEELCMARESIKAFEERVADLEKSTAMLQENLSSAQEKSFEVDRLQEEQAKLIVRCSELEEAVRREAARVGKIPPRVIKKVKDDYLASEEFQEEKFECTMDGHSQGFNDCIRQVCELDPNFDVTRLKEDLSKEEGSEER